jgi:hypothetical protein
MAFVLVEALLLGGLGLVLMLVPGREARLFEAQVASGLPRRESLSVVSGHVVHVARRHSRRRTFLRPVVEFTVDGRTYRIQTRASYSPSVPFQTGGAAAVLYAPRDPQKAWLEWEFDKLTAEKTGFHAALASGVDWIKARYFRFATIVVGASAALLLINLFVPVFRLFARPPIAG